MSATVLETAAASRAPRFAVVCTDGRVRRWQGECVSQLVEQGVGTPVLVVVHQDAAAVATPPRRDMPGTASTARARRAVRRSRALELVDLAESLAHVPGTTSTRQLPADEVASATAAELGRYDLDFLLWFAEAPIARAWAEAARLGVWTFRHAEEGECVDATACATRLVSAGDVTEACLVRIGATRADDEVLYQGCFGTRASGAANLDRVLLGASEWSTRACRGLACGGSLPPAPRAVPSVIAPPASAGRASHVFARLASGLRRIWRALFLLETWNIGVVDAPIADVVRRSRVDGIRWLDEPARLTFRADPFVVERGDRPLLLFEAYDYRTLKGTIQGGRFDPERLSVEAVPMLERAEHMSYPFLLEEDGELFCIPETSEAGVVELLRMSASGDGWQHEATLLDGRAVVDPTVFRHQGHWWLLGTDDATGPNEKLYGWHAERLRGPWTEHPLNPIKCDVRSSRPAGRPFTIDGALYRPAQDCSQGYGGAVAIQRILTLTPSAFDEISVARIAPEREGPYPDGLHTLCPLGDRIVVDGLRRGFFPIAALVKVLETRASARRKAARVRSHRMASAGGAPSPRPTAAPVVAGVGTGAEANPMRRTG